MHPNSEPFQPPAKRRQPPYEKAAIRPFNETELQTYLDAVFKSGLKIQLSPELHQRLATLDAFILKLLGKHQTKPSPALFALDDLALDMKVRLATELLVMLRAHPLLAVCFEGDNYLTEAQRQPLIQLALAQNNPYVLTYHLLGTIEQIKDIIKMYQGELAPNKVKMARLTQCLQTLQTLQKQFLSLKAYSAPYANHHLGIIHFFIGFIYANREMPLYNKMLADSCFHAASIAFRLAEDFLRKQDGSVAILHLNLFTYGQSLYELTATKSYDAVIQYALDHHLLDVETVLLSFSQAKVIQAAEEKTPSSDVSPCTSPRHIPRKPR